MVNCDCTKSDLLKFKKLKNFINNNKEKYS